MVPPGTYHEGDTIRKFEGQKIIVVTNSEVSIDNDTYRRNQSKLIEHTRKETIVRKMED